MLKLFPILALLALNSTLVLSQALAQPESDPVITQRREMARDLLRVLGFEGYPPLDSEHAHELVGKMRE